MSFSACNPHRREGRSYVAGCADCREENRVHKERQRRRRGAIDRQTWLDSHRGRSHGLRSTYTHGCRCSACTEAERVYKADLRARRRPENATSPRSLP